MSRTYRHVQPGWGPGNPDFDSLFPNIRTSNHQRRDRPGSTTFRTMHRFSKHGKNSTYNLLQKIDKLREQEARSL